MRYAREPSAAVFVRPCHLVPAAWGPFLGGRTRGHTLWSAAVRGLENSGTLVWCAKCGAYTASGRACGLLQQCLGAPTSVGAVVRLRRRARAHPLTMLQLTWPHRVLPPCDLGQLGGFGAAAEEEQAAEHAVEGSLARASGAAGGSRVLPV